MLAAVISFKLFLWPLVVWLAATGRLRSAAATLAVAAAGTVAAWAVLGFAGFRDYPELLSRLTDAVQAKSYSADGVRPGRRARLSKSPRWLLWLREPWCWR